MTCTCTHDAGSHDLTVGYCRAKRDAHRNPCGCRRFVAAPTPEATTADKARYGECSGCHGARTAEDFARSLTHCVACIEAADAQHAASSARPEATGAPEPTSGWFARARKLALNNCRGHLDYTDRQLSRVAEAERAARAAERASRSLLAIRDDEIEELRATVAALTAERGARAQRMKEAWSLARDGEMYFGSWTMPQIEAFFRDLTTLLKREETP